VTLWGTTGGDSYPYDIFGQCRPADCHTHTTQDVAKTLSNMGPIHSKNYIMIFPNAKSPD